MTYVPGHIKPQLYLICCMFLSFFVSLRLKLRGEIWFLVHVVRLSPLSPTSPESFSLCTNKAQNPSE